MRFPQLPKLPPLHVAAPEDGIVDVPDSEVTFLPDEDLAPTEPMACPAGCVVTAPCAADVPEALEDEVEVLDESSDEEEESEEVIEKEASARLAQFKAIRAARRAAAEKEKEEKEEKDMTPAEKKAEEKEEKEEAEKTAAVVPEAPMVEQIPADLVPEITWAPLLSEDDMAAKEKNAAIDMTLRAADTDSPFYVMYMDGHPFGELHLADVDSEEDFRDVFVDAAFTRGVRETVAACGPADAFKTLKVRYYAAATKEVEAVKRAKVEIAQHADEAFRRRAAALKGDLLTVLHLAMEASRKNFILENPLKDTLVENMRKAGLQERIAIDVIEDAFVKSGAQYLKAMVEKAEEWLGYEPEALKQIENTVTKMAYVHPLDLVSAPQDEEIPVQPKFERIAAPSATPDLDADTEAALRVGRIRRSTR